MTYEAHLRALASIATDPAVDPETLYRRLRRLERIAHDAATAQCNGAAYNGQPFRPDWDADGNETEETEWRIFLADLSAKVADCFGGSLPPGFHFNGDARGYAFKIEPGCVPDGMLTDWGRNGIIAPERGML